MFRDASDALDALRLTPHVVPASSKAGAEHPPMLRCCTLIPGTIHSPAHLLLSQTQSLPTSSAGSDSSDEGSDGSNGDGSPPPAPHGGSAADALSRTLGAPLYLLLLMPGFWLVCWGGAL